MTVIDDFAESVTIALTDYCNRHGNDVTGNRMSFARPLEVRSADGEWEVAVNDIDSEGNKVELPHLPRHLRGVELDRFTEREDHGEDTIKVEFVGFSEGKQYRMHFSILHLSSMNIVMSYAINKRHERAVAVAEASDLRRGQDGE